MCVCVCVIFYTNIYVSILSFINPYKNEKKKT